MKASIVALLAAVAAVNAGQCEDNHASCLLSLNLDIAGVVDLSLDICSSNYDSCCAQTKASLTAPITSTYSSLSTFTQTNTKTISECEATITDCPYRTAPVTTVTTEVTSTYCPVTATQVPSTISTVTTTSTCVVSTCPAVVTNCPYEQHPTSTVTTYEVYSCPTTIATSIPVSSVPITSLPASTTPCTTTGSSVISVPESSKAATTTPCTTTSVIYVPESSKPAASSPAASCSTCVEVASSAYTQVPAKSAPAVPYKSSPAVPASNQTTPYQQANGAETVARFGASALFVVAAGAMML